MKNISSLENIHTIGKFGNYENKNDKEILKIKEVKNIFICQIFKYKNSTLDINKLKIDNLNFPEDLKCNFNLSTRILWMGPNNYLIISEKLELMKDILSIFEEKDFAVTDLSHSRTFIEIEGEESKEVIKKGCPLDINNLKEGDCANSIFHGITITIDFMSNNSKKIRILALRSFGSSLYHSITDACLEYGYISI